MLRPMHVSLPPISEFLLTPVVSQCLNQDVLQRLQSTGQVPLLDLAVVSPPHQLKLHVCESLTAVVFQGLDDDVLQRRPRVGRIPLLPSVGVCRQHARRPQKFGFLKGVQRRYGLRSLPRRDPNL